MATSITTQISTLKQYTACDIADALLKLSIPNAGYLPDLTLRTSVTSTTNTPLIAPASTVLFASKSKPEANANFPESNIPKGQHYVDLTEKGTIVITQQPEGQQCAVLGGIMALRMRMRGAVGVVVLGRVRDLVELESTGLPIWSRGTSIVGTGAEAKPHAIQVPLNIDGTVIKPGDLVFSDATNGVVIIPQEKVEEVVALLPKLVEADERVKEDVEKGMSVQEAFKKHRG
ncbi:4-hydroxy-4-methyl-2-oxoglutarate aldolase [Lachnellula hyalina]|uniref:4-hydroxy-4-methyl-2-oxoglutarate aldolase n=1 Tax=Lachnellula hyalina TaxID=1316788 RepID=A0A8H8QXT7_9HELO|nr:4-hydroxy-4-methyl-2-oxoglutarate aldolase [Lachnellula hyalina]TVY23329.1 4-hydroxy-4-methyl-2-oxoglutarate aldolase [Lachnellula hyalina]